MRIKEGNLPLHAFDFLDIARLGSSYFEVLEKMTNLNQRSPGDQ